MSFPPIHESVNELIATARRGNRSSVAKHVHMLMQDLGKYTTKIFDALVSQLRPEILTKVIQLLNEGQPLPPPLLYAKETGSMAISIVYIASLGCLKHPEAKEETVSIIRGHLQTILPWILIDLGHRPGFFNTQKRVNAKEPTFVLHAGLLRGIMDLDPRVEADILASPLAVDIALVLWSTLTTDSQPLFLANQKFRIPEAGCAIIDVVSRFVRVTSPCDPAPITKRLANQPAPCDQDTFVKCLLLRGSLLRVLVQERQDTMGYLKALTSCKALVEIHHHLIVKNYPSFKHLSGGTSHVQVYSCILASLTRARVDAEVQDQYIEHIVDLFLFIFTEWVRRSAASFQHNLVNCLGAGGLLSAISILLKKRNLSKTTQDKVFRLVGKVFTSLIFPVAVKTLRKRILKDPEWATPGRPTPGVKSPFVEIRNDLLTLSSDMKTAYRSIPRQFPICDNLSHHSNNPVPFLDSKACSNCQSVVYCSVRCQTDDWTARHRFECKHLHEDYQAQKQEERRYRQRMRAHHLGLAIRFFHGSLAGKFGHTTPHHASLAVPQVFLVDLRTVPYKPAYMTLDQYASDQRTRLPAHLLRRFEDMLTELENPDLFDKSFAFRMLHAEVRFGVYNVSLIGTVSGKSMQGWCGGARIMSSMVSFQSISEAQEPVMPVPQFEPMQLPRHLIQE